MNRLEEQVEIKSELKLRGTLLIPNTDEELVPAVLFIVGSGPGDRDGNITKAKMELNIYKQLAEKLTDAGYASLRYDKRGVGESEGSLEKAGMWDLVNDANSALQFLRNRSEIDEKRVIVLGHSEGCLLATALNEKDLVSGLILLGGAGATLAESMKYQREQSYQELKELKGFKGWLIKKMNLIDKAEKKTEKVLTKMINSDQDVIRVQLIAKMPAKWFREHFRYDLWTGMKKITCPVLAMTGSKDLQSSPEKVLNVPELVSGEAEVHIIEEMNHILMKQKDDFPISKVKKEYEAFSGAPIHPELSQLIINWLNRKFKQ